MVSRMVRCWLAAALARRVFLLSAMALAIAAPCLAAEHPYILWTRSDLVALRKKVETEPWATAQYERMLGKPDEHGRSLARLFQFAVMGDKAAGEAEKKELLSLLRAQDPLGGSQEFNVLRYDLLYDSLAADERRAVEDCFRRYIEYSVVIDGVFDPNLFNDGRNYSRYDARRYTRSNWLPNIIWPRKVSGNLMALAIGDEAVIRRTWSAYGSWQWYFDEYLCDTGLYAEEFSKMGASPGAMLLYCMGLERLGLGGLGFGYRGRGGATMRGHMAGLIDLGYPRVDLGSARPHYPMMTMGDLRQMGSSQHDQFGGFAFQHSLVRGYLADGTGGNERWVSHGAWGGTKRGKSPQWDLDKTEKMQIPLWFEIAHRLWPEAGFDYFLARMRGPDEDRYVPSLFFGLDPIDPAKVRPPRAPSAVWPERGIAMLRAEDGPAYWESDAPAVAMRLATDYAHNVNDAFAILGYYALNRPIYLNRQVAQSYAYGWSRSVRSHCGVAVDAMEPKFTSAVAVRHGFDAQAKFVAARSEKVYPDVDMERALFLTREYLLDVSHLSAAEPHTYGWLVHALGRAAPDDERAWSPSETLAAGFYRTAVEIEGERTLDAGGRTWAMTVLQTCALADPKQSRVGEAWYACKIGVRMTMLGEAGTSAFIHKTPEREKSTQDGKPIPPAAGAKAEPANEFGGITIVAARQAQGTTFVVLHEPFKGGDGRIAEFRRIQESPDTVAVAVIGKPGTGIDDRVMIRLGDEFDKPVTVAGDGESFTFADRAHVRIGKDRVDVSGTLISLKVRVAGSPRLFVNGREQPAVMAGGFLTFVAAP